MGIGQQLTATAAMHMVRKKHGSNSIKDIQGKLFPILSAWSFPLEVTIYHFLLCSSKNCLYIHK